MEMEEIGEQNRLYGYIEEKGDRESCQRNEAIMSTLPVDDLWPPLERHMFGWAPYDTQVTKRYSRVIHFAASLTEVEWDLRLWIDKFEVLLRCLHWERAVVQLETFYLGEHTFTWHPKAAWRPQPPCYGHLDQTTEWWDFESSMDLKELAQLRSV